MLNAIRNYEYDGRGNVIREWYDNQGLVEGEQKISNLYDADGQLIASETRNEYGIVLYRITYATDADGNRVVTTNELPCCYFPFEILGKDDNRIIVSDRKASIPPEDYRTEKTVHDNNDRLLQQMTDEDKSHSEKTYLYANNSLLPTQVIL